MDLFIGVKVIGIFALVVGSLISAMTGGILTSIAGFFLTSILITSVLPSEGTKKFNISGLRSRVPRLELFQRIGGMVGVIGCWVLAVMGGWEFVPAGIVLTISMLMGPIMRFIMRRRGHRIGVLEMELNNQSTPQTVQIVKEILPTPNPNSTSISINETKIQTPSPNQSKSNLNLNSNANYQMMPLPMQMTA